MPTSRLTIALLAMLSGAAACVGPEAHRKVLSANEALRAQLADLSEHQRQLNLENERLRADVERLSKGAVDAEYVRQQKEKLEGLLKRFDQGGASSVPGIDVIRTNEGTAFRVAGSLLFASGKAEITEGGREALKHVITTLQEEGKHLRVNGYTDDQPIQHSAWKSNLELSVARSLAVANYLIQTGVKPEYVAVGGYGEYQPAVQGSTEDARQKNRRVEILMLDR